MGHPGIPLSVISKAAEVQLLYAVDKVMLGKQVVSEGHWNSTEIPLRSGLIREKVIFVNSL